MKKLQSNSLFCIYVHFHSTSWCPCAYIQKTSPIGLVLHFVLRRERDSLAKFIFAYRSRLAEIRAPVRGLRRPCVFSKKEKKEPLLVPSSFLRRERDSNPRSLSAQRFSRPPQSTTLPSLLHRNWFATIAPLNSGSRSPRYIFELWFFQIGCKSTAFFSNTQIFYKNSCQYAKNIVILHPK